MIKRTYDIVSLFVRIQQTVAIHDNFSDCAAIRPLLNFLALVILRELIPHQCHDSMA